MKKLNRFAMYTVAVVSSLAVTRASACDPPQVVRVTSVAVTGQRTDCGKVVLLRKLESFQDPVHSRVETCQNELAAAEAAVQDAMEARDLAAGRVGKSLERVECAAGILESMCHQVRIGGTIYEKEQVGEALKTLIEDHKTDKQILQLSEAALTQRQETLAKVAEKVAKWKRAEQELLQQVALLKAEHSVQAAVASGSRNQPAKAVSSSPEQLLSDLNQLLDSNRKVTVTAARVTSAPKQDDDLSELLNEVDAIIGSQSASTSASR